MGGRGAPDDFMMGDETQVWLAIISGKYFHHMKKDRYNLLAGSLENQESLISYLNSLCIT